MKNYIPLHVHSHYSLLDGLSRPNQIADRCHKIGVKSCAITDHGSISGAVQIHTTLKAKKIKPILGCELYLSFGDLRRHMLYLDSSWFGSKIHQYYADCKNS